jgi:hypothetical protein
MSQHEQHDNSGILFRNDRKSRDSDRDYSGSATIAGVEYWMSAWIKEAKNGSKFLTFSFKPKEEKSAARRNFYGRKNHSLETNENSGASVPFNDEIPFAPEWRG